MPRVAWVESASRHFTARHAESDADEVEEVLDLLERTRERLAERFPSMPTGVEVVVHGTDAQLAVAQPVVPLVRRLTAPAARRYVVGWPARGTVHVLTPHLLDRHAPNVPESREMERLAPAALYTQLVVGHNNPHLPPPFRVGTLVRGIRWAWLVHGAAQWFSGQTAHARAAIGRRLHEGPPPAFPPGLADAPLLGGTVVDLIVREEGESAAVELACRLPARGPKAGLVEVFDGRPLRHTEAAWRGHLTRIVTGGR
jgi:hypothetical protein